MRMREPSIRTNTTIETSINSTIQKPNLNLSMQNFARASVCLFAFFVCYLQARPIYLGDLGLSFIIKSVSCDHNMTFVSPENMETQCCREAFAGIVEQLQHAKTNCTDHNAQINSTLDSLHFYSDRCPQSTNSSDCKWEKQRGGKTLVDLVSDIESFLQLLNTMQSMS